MIIIKTFIVISVSQADNFAYAGMASDIVISFPD